MACQLVRHSFATFGGGGASLQGTDRWPPEAGEQLPIGVSSAYIGGGYPIFIAGVHL